MDIIIIIITTKFYFIEILSSKIKLLNFCNQK